MPLTALHPQLGVLDATMVNLGADSEWQAVHRPPSPLGLTCRGCAGIVHAKVSHRGLRFFAHARAEIDCIFTGESLSHRLLKAELAAAIRSAGWVADLEVPGTGWRADVLASSHDGATQIAWEAQLASATSQELSARTWRMRAELAAVVWVTDKQAPWLRHVPSIRVLRKENADALRVVDGTARFLPHWCPNPNRCQYGADSVLDGQPEPCPGHGRWQEAPEIPLTDFVAHVLKQRLIVRPMIAPDAIERSSRASDGGIVWASRSDRDAEEAQVRATERHEAWEREQAVLLARWRANVEALLQRQRALLRPTVEWIYREHVAYPQIPDPPGEPLWAMGVPVSVGNRPVAVIAPVASRITPKVRNLLKGLIVFVATEAERSRVARACAPNQRIVLLRVAPDASSTVVSRVQRSRP